MCNDCHTPKGLIPKYATKASNGFWHSFAFTTGRFPDPLRIKARNHEITENACRKCHAPITMSIDQVGTEEAAYAEAVTPAAATVPTPFPRRPGAHSHDRYFAEPP